METWKRSAFLLVAVTAFLFGSRADAAQSCVLVIPGVQGESAVIPGGMDVLSFSSGLANSDGRAIGGFGGAAARARFSDFHFIKRIDKASPVLFESAATGQHYGDAEVPGILGLDALTGGVSHTDPEADQYTGGHQDTIGRHCIAADMKQLGKHWLIRCEQRAELLSHRSQLVLRRRPGRFWPDRPTANVLKADPQSRVTGRE